MVFLLSIQIGKENLKGKLKLSKVAWLDFSSEFKILWPLILWSNRCPLESILYLSSSVPGNYTELQGHLLLTILEMG